MSLLSQAYAVQYCGDDLNRDRHSLYVARLEHARKYMLKAELPAMLVSDPNTIFYLTGARNMQLFGLRSPSRFLLCFQDGPVVLFEYVGCEHLARTLPTITHIRSAIGLSKLSSGDKALENAQDFAATIRELVDDQDPSIDRIGVDRLPFQTIDALRRHRFKLVDADEVMIPARAIKLPVEIPYLREAMQRVEAAVEYMEQTVEPDMSESEAWAGFHYAFMAKEGQYVSTRLFQSGPNTYPYFQEAGTRRLVKGDLLCLDTDALGYEGYAVDFSRTFLCGDGKASSHQTELYHKAREQLEHNASLLQPGIEYREIASKAWDIPEEHQKSRYYCIGHGLGMAGEFPNIPHLDESDEYPLSGTLEPGMIICIESYVGTDSSNQGVKLEDQFLILEDQVVRMSTYAFDSRLSAATV